MSRNIILQHSCWFVLSLFVATACGFATAQSEIDSDSNAATHQSPMESTDPGLASAVLAGGCFWCVESDLEKAPGVINVFSGYTGGRTENPKYQSYTAGGHREAVFVVYDPKRVNYAGLVEYLIKHIDPTDGRGSFNDKGLQYSPAIYFANEEEKSAAERVLKSIQDLKVYRGRLNVAVERRSAFWPAEDYHQDYYKKNMLKYGYYRFQSGRDAFIIKHWAARAKLLELPDAYPVGSVAVVAGEKSSASNDPPAWRNFKKPSLTELRRKLSPIQFEVTQKEGTEPAFRNALWNNHREGIYVDVVSGEPLFSSIDKFESGTGWPSFVKPLESGNIVFREDRQLFVTRTEVRSRHGDSHLGHVFNDGPKDRGGMRYCMNSAALRFVPKDKLEVEGFQEYLALFDTP